MFRELQDIEDLAAYDFKPISFRRPHHRQAGDLSRKRLLSSKRTIVIGPMVAFGGHPERAGLGWVRFGMLSPVLASQVVEEPQCHQ